MDNALFSVVTTNHDPFHRGMIKGLAWMIMTFIACFLGWLWRKFGDKPRKELDKDPPVLKNTGVENDTTPL